MANLFRISDAFTTKKSRIAIRYGFQTHNSMIPLNLFVSVSRISSFFAMSVGVAALLTAPSRASAQPAALMPEIGVTDAVISEPNGAVALFGYDPVAYFTNGQAIAGKPGITATEGGLIWRFLNEGNLQAFKATPAAYVPLFGGYDPIDVAAERLVAGNPEIFAVLDDRLVLFRSPVSRASYLESAANRQSALAMWPQLSRALVRPRQ